MKKVAGYCRVSTDKDDQANSLASQQRFFREYISHNSEWELYDIYADEGITGTSTKKRNQFMRMIDDAHAGKFHLIITKEVSRFSRNIMDTISYTRDLKSHGIGVIFMADGFSTLDSDAELRLSIMGSIAQEESRKTSVRVKWGQERQMERGVVFGSSMLGYDVKNGKLSVNAEGAELVRLIFHKYGVEQKGTSVIAKELIDAGYKTYTGKTFWNASNITKILKNEKYVGDLVQRKTFTPDYLTHAKKYNHGEAPLIVQRDHHQPIISRELWDQVQKQIQKRCRNNRSLSVQSTQYAFSGKIKCAECGASFVSRTKIRKDGTSFKRWGCYTAVKYGTQRTDAYGNTIGCSIGKQIRDDLFWDVIRYVVQSLPMDYSQIVQNVVSIVTKARSADGYASEQTDKLQNKIEQIFFKKSNAIDAFLSGLLTEDDITDIQQRYNSKLEELRNQLTMATKQEESFCIDDLAQEVESIISCKNISTPYVRAMVDYIHIHKSGIMEVKLNHLRTIWTLKLVQE